MKIILSTLAGTTNHNKVDGLELELPQIPAVGSIFEFDDNSYEVTKIFYTFDYLNELRNIYAQIKDYK